MAAVVHPNPSRFGSLRAIAISPARPRLVSEREVRALEPRAFPQAHTTPSLSAIFPEEELEQYAFIFCQGGFRALGMTFEQFLLVAEVIKPREDSLGDE